MKLTVSLDEHLFAQAVEATEFADHAELLNEALEALLEKKGHTPLRASEAEKQETTSIDAKEPPTQNVAEQSTNETSNEKPPPVGPAARFFGEYLLYYELISKEQ